MFHKETMTVSYTDIVDASDNCYVFLSAFKGNRLIGFGSTTVAKGENRVDYSIKVKDMPEIKYVITLLKGNGVNSIALFSSSSFFNIYSCIKRSEIGVIWSAKTPVSPVLLFYLLFALINSFNFIIDKSISFIYSLTLVMAI